MNILLIGFGGAIGALFRYSIGLSLNKPESNSIPFGTWIVNIAGSLLLGLIAHLYVKGMISDVLWFFGGVGFCGALTTFSTFSYEAFQLVHEKKHKRAIVYVVSSVLLGLLAAVVGWFLANPF